MNPLFLHCVKGPNAWKEMAPGCSIGKRKVDGGNVMLWVMLCWVTLANTYLNSDADQVHPWGAVVAMIVKSVSY